LLYEKAEQYNAETVWGSYQVSTDGTGIMEKRQYPNILLLGDDKLIEYECLDMGERLQTSIWNILFRLDFIRSLRIEFEQHVFF
jgi:hypothetical protein